jgi:uncharacterized protein YjbI with pentapeptide repeats
VSRARYGNFAGTRLDRADLRGGDFRHAHFVDAGARAARFDGARLERALFAGANLVGAQMRRCAARWCDLSRARLDAADLTGSDLRGANLHRAADADARWDGADLANARRTDPVRANAEDFDAARA